MNNLNFQKNRFLGNLHIIKLFIVFLKYNSKNNNNKSYTCAKYIIMQAENKFTS